MTAADVGLWLLKVLGGATGAALIVLGWFKWFGDKWFDSRLESQKASLGRLTEQLKHDLQREMLKAELATSKMHEVYGHLWELVVRAHGAVGSLVGLSFGPSYEDYETEDFAKVLADAPLTRGQRTQITEAIASDRRAGIKELEKALRDAQLHKARVQVFEASNYAALKSPFLSPAVREKTKAATSAIWSVWVEIHMNTLPGNPDRKSPVPALKEADAKVTDLEVQISSELHPGGKHVGIASAIAGLGSAAAVPRLPDAKERSGVK